MSWFCQNHTRCWSNTFLIKLLYSIFIIGFCAVVITTFALPMLPKIPLPWKASYKNNSFHVINARISSPYSDEDQTCRKILYNKQNNSRIDSIPDITGDEEILLLLQKGCNVLKKRLVFTFVTCSYKLQICSHLFENFAACFSNLLAMIQACCQHLVMIVNSLQWPTPSKSVAIHLHKENSFVCYTSSVLIQILNLGHCCD